MLNKVKHYLHLIFVKNWLYVLLIVGTLVLDLVTKGVMESILIHEGNSIELIPNLFEFQLVYNTGSFSGWFGSDVGHILLILISFAGAIGLPYLFIRYYKEWNKGMLIGLALAISGDIGNLVDRLVYVNGHPRGVIDFLHFYIPAWNFNWPTFNVADMCLVIGVILFVIFYIIYDNKIEKEKKLLEAKVLEETKKKMLENEEGEANGK